VEQGVYILPEFSFRPPVGLFPQKVSTECSLYN